MDTLALTKPHFSYYVAYFMTNSMYPHCKNQTPINESVTPKKYFLLG